MTKKDKLICKIFGPLILIWCFIILKFGLCIGLITGGILFIGIICALIFIKENEEDCFYGIMF